MLSLSLKTCSAHPIEKSTEALSSVNYTMQENRRLDFRCSLEFGVVSASSLVFPKQHLVIQSRKTADENQVSRCYQQPTSADARRQLCPGGEGVIHI